MIDETRNKTAHRVMVFGALIASAAGGGCTGLGEKYDAEGHLVVFIGPGEFTVFRHLEYEIPVSLVSTNDDDDDENSDEYSDEPEELLE